MVRLQSKPLSPNGSSSRSLRPGCSLVLRGSEQTEMSGNLLLDRLLGAHLYWSGDETPPQFAPRHA